MRSPGWLVVVMLLGCGARTGLDTSSSATEAPDAAAVGSETCDGTDEDDDGRVDEGLAPLSCGDGTCSREIPSCVDGRAATCPPVVARPEVCNRADDDCDGRVDEGLGFEPIGEPIVVREAYDERTGSCSECSEVTGAQLVSFGRELHAVWFLRFSGYVDVPVAYARRLDDHGHPLEASRVFLDEATTQISLAPSHSGNTMVAFCQRLPDRRDYPRARLFDGRGDRVGELLVPSLPDQRCYRAPRVVWTGERHLFARSNRGTGTILDVADRDGHSLGASELAWDDDDLEVVFDGERATLARDEESGALAILELDRQGAVALSTRVPFPTTRRLYARVGTLEATGGPLAAIATMSPRVAEYSLSWFRFDRGATALRSVAEVALPPTYVQHIGLLRRGADEILGVLRIGDRELSQLLIIRLTEGGEELDRWTLGEGAGALETTEVHSHLGSVFVSYVRQLDRGVNQVEVLELGCVE